MCGLTLLRLLLCFMIGIQYSCQTEHSVDNQIQAFDRFNLVIGQLGELRRGGNFETLERNSSEALKVDIEQSQGWNYVGVSLVVSYWHLAYISCFWHETADIGM